MANSEQLDILKQSPTIWNEWRSENLHESIDLRGADLRSADLEHADLHKAKLCKVNLVNANLIQANFSGAKTLAGLSLFVIADITNPRCSPLELQATIPDYKVPFVPILQENEHPFGMFQDLSQYPWVLKLLKYDTSENLIKVLEEAVIRPALEKARELELIKAEAIKERHVNDYLPREINHD